MQEIEAVNGGDPAAAAGIGLAMVGIAIAIVAGPVGWFGIGVASFLSGSGGAVVGKALYDSQT